MKLLPWLRRDIGALALLLALALAVIAPVLPAPRSSVLGWPGDNLLYVYTVGWMAQAPLSGQSPFIDPNANYPDKLALLANEVPYLSNLVVAPVTLAFGPVLGYNLVVLLSLLLSGYFAYLWALRVSGSRIGGLVAGLAFLLSPYRSTHLYGHLNLIATFGLPLFFWALDVAMCADRRHWLAGLLLAGATFLVGSATQYYLVICLLAGGAYALMLTLPDLKALLQRGWLAALGALCGALASAMPYLQLVDARTFAGYDIETTRMWSAEPLNFLLPHPQHPLWGDAVSRIYSEPLWIEKTLYLGIVALALALVALLGWRAGRRRILAWGGMLLFSLLLALGTDLHVFGKPLQAEHPIWLPAYYVAHLPFVNLMRVWARFGVITGLFTALLAGVGATVVLRRFARWSAPIAVALCLLVIVDFAPAPVPTTTVPDRAVDRWLAAQPEPIVFGPIPATNAWANHNALIGSLSHNQRFPAFMHQSHMPPAYMAYREAAFRFPDPAAIHDLRHMGLDYLLLERQFLDGKRGPDWPLVEQGLADTGAPIIADMEGVLVVDLRGVK